MKIDDHEFDVAVMACRAVRPEEYDPHRWGIWSKLVATGLPMPPTYPGSIYKFCAACGIEVQVGPRQQEAIETYGEDRVQILCLIDASLAATASPDGVDTPVHNLGNPYKEKS